MPTQRQDAAWRYILWLALIALSLTTVLSAAQAQRPDCTFTTSTATGLFAIPATHPTFQVGSIGAFETYTATAFMRQHYAITDSAGVSLGWVDRRSGTVSGACDDLPAPYPAVTDFPTVCTFTPAETVYTYASPADMPSTASPPSDDVAYVNVLPAAAPVLVVERAGFDMPVVALFVDEARAGGWVAVDSGTLTGACEALPQGIAGRVTAGARLWSQPDVNHGIILAEPPAGTAVQIYANQRVVGDIVYGDDVRGVWVYTVIPDVAAGWLWIERVQGITDGDMTLTPPAARADAFTNPPATPSRPLNERPATFSPIAPPPNPAAPFENQ